MQKEAFCTNTEGLFFYLFLRRDFLQTAHVRTQYFRNENRAIRLLIILQQCGHSTPDCQTGTVEGMHKFRLCLGVAAEADIRTTGLEVFEVGAGRDLPVGFVAWNPHFDIVLFSLP
jgi:hypothetical protein